MSHEIERPTCAEDEHLTYLDDLRESSAVNMFGAKPYIQEAFPELNKMEVEAIHKYWMESFGQRHGGY